MKQELERWLQEHRLERIDACNLTCTTTASLARLVAKTYPSLHVKKRFHMLTQLDVFQLTDAEMLLLDDQKRKRNDSVYSDAEKVADYFIQRWKKYEQMPSGDEIMNLTGKKYIPLKEFVAYMLPKIENTKGNVSRAVASSPTVMGDMQDADMSLLAKIVGTDVDALNTNLHVLLDQPNERLFPLLRAIAPHMEKLSRTINYLMSDDPKVARDQDKQYETLLMKNESN